MSESFVYGQDLSDADYLREMARLQDQLVGAPVREHTDRLRMIADSIERMRGTLELVQAGVPDIKAFVTRALKSESR